MGEVRAEMGNSELRIWKLAHVQAVAEMYTRGYIQESGYSTDLA
jgi:hypothetical protein